MSVTLVTGLWDLGRDKLSEGWSRSFDDHYLKKFDDLLKIKSNIIIFGDSNLEKFVWERRESHNTQFIKRELDWFINNEFYNKIQNIRTNPDWYNQAGWLSESTQAKLEMYNPLVMSKIFLLNDAKILDKFNSEKLFWIDAGISNTVHIGYFTHDNVLEKIEKKINKFLFVCFPYNANTEIHGFSYPKINEWAENDVKLVGRGGFFGGTKESIGEINSIYYNLLNETLTQKYMGTEESLFSIMVYKYPKLVDYFEIEENGLLGTFFENAKNENLVIKNKLPKNLINDLDINKTSLYVIGFNSPKQLETLITSMLSYDSDFLNKPKKYLLNNSTNHDTDKQYEKLCEEHNFEIIWPNENLGICGGRQFIAEHFEKSDSDYMFFFEDDMFFYPKESEVCKNGFNRYVKNLYQKSLSIIKNYNFDFLKLNYTEFFGDNGTQWSWYNVPQSFRESYWPECPKLPEHGLNPNSPKTKFTSITSHNGIPVATGEIFYCNWPQIVSKKGNKTMFLDTKWAHPYEQTWMSHMFQETVKGNLNPGLLLLTPTEHNRFEHYDGKLRKES